MPAVIDYHERDCAACTALREAVQLGPADLVFHCSEHGPFVDRAHSAFQDCPRCADEDARHSTLGRLVREATGGTSAGDGE